MENVLEVTGYLVHCNKTKHSSKHGEYERYSITLNTEPSKFATVVAFNLDIEVQNRFDDLLHKPITITSVKYMTKYRNFSMTKGSIVSKHITELPFRMEEANKHFKREPIICEEIKDLENLENNTPITIEGKITSVGSSQRTAKDSLKKIILEDTTGSIQIACWGEMKEDILRGENVLIKNAILKKSSYGTSINFSCLTSSVEMLDGNKFSDVSVTSEEVIEGDIVVASFNSSIWCGGCKRKFSTDEVETLRIKKSIKCNEGEAMDCRKRIASRKFVSKINGTISVMTQEDSETVLNLDNSDLIEKCLPTLASMSVDDIEESLINKRIKLSHIKSIVTSIDFIREC